MRLGTGIAQITESAVRLTDGAELPSHTAVRTAGVLAGQEPAGQYMSRDDARQETARILAHDQGGRLT